LKIEKISDVCVSTIDMDKREVCLEGHKETFHFKKDSMALLLQKAMTRKATFITKDRVIDWIDLKKNMPIKAYTEVLQKSENMFLDLAEQSPNMIFISQKGRLVYVNKRCEEIMGYKKKEFCSPDFNSSLVFAPESVNQTKSVRRRLMKGKEVAPLEYRLLTKEERKIDVIVKSKLIKYRGETAILGIVTDIAEYTKTEEERNKLVHSYGERIKELNCLHGISRIIEKFDDSLEQIFQRTANLLPSAWQYPDITCARISFEGREFKTKNFKETPWKQKSNLKVKGKRVGVVEVYYLEEKSAIAEGPFLEEEKDLIDTVAELLERVIEYKKTVEELRKNIEKYNSLVTNVPVDVWTVDSKDNPIYTNPNVEKLLGYTPEEIHQGGNWFWHERTHPEDRERVTEAYNLFFTKRKTGDVEYRMQRKDGTWIWIHDKILKVYEKDGELYVDGITWEITKDKKT